MFKWIKVVSSFVDCICWLEKDEKIAVKYNNGKVWLFPATKDEYNAFLSAPSKGKFLHTRLKRQAEEYIE